MFDANTLFFLEHNRFQTLSTQNHLVLEKLLRLFSFFKVLMLWLICADNQSNP